MFGNLRRIGRAATGSFRSAAVALFAVLIIADVPARADTITWNGGGDGVSWHDPDNWDAAAVPTDADDVLITLGGTFTVTTGAPANAGTLTIGNAIGAQELEVSGGTLTVAGNVDIDTNATVTARADLSAGGLLDVAVGGALIIDNILDCCEIVIVDVTSGVTNSGMIQLTSTMARGATLNVSGGIITNNSGGTIDLLVGAGGARTLGADVDNSGTINFNVSAGVGGSLTNTVGGLIQVDGIDDCCEAVPTISDGLINSGMIQITSSANQSSGIVVTSGMITNNSGGTIDLLVGAGGARSLGAAVNNSGTINFNVTTDVGGSLTNNPAGMIQVDSFDVCCEVVPTIADGLINSGMIQITSSVAGDSGIGVTGGVITNNSGGTIDLLVGAGGSRTLGADIENSGTINFKANTDVGGSLTNTLAGLIQVDNADSCCELVPTINGDLLNSGLLQITSSVAGDSGIAVTGGMITNNSGGTIELLVGAGGARTLEADVSNSGDLNVLAPVVLNGEYEQQADGNLRMELGGLMAGENDDVLAVTGQAKLNGTLNVSLMDGLSLQVGDRFEVVTYGSHDGTFSSINGPASAAFTPEYGENGVTLVTSFVAPDLVVEPPLTVCGAGCGPIGIMPLLLTLLGLCGLRAARRRR